MEKVAVIGVGQTHHASKRLDVNIATLVREAVLRALADAQLDFADIDAVVLGTAPDALEGVMQPEQWLAGAIGAVGKPIIRIHTAGSVGGSTAVAAAYHVGSGAFDRVLAVAFEKQSEGSTLWGLSPKFTFGRTFLAGAASVFAGYCRSYIDRYKPPLETGAHVVVKARQNATRNPYAHLSREVSVAEVMESPMLWDPLRRLECCPTSDGAVAMVFSSARLAKGRNDVAWVRGAAAMAEAHPCPGRETVKPRSAVECALTVYRQAGISSPHRELDVAEIYEPFSWTEVMWYEAFGFCDEGEGWRLLLEGDTDAGGTLPVNPSGGVLSTNPIGASGMIRAAEAAQQVRGRCEGGHQVDGARLALSHAVGGYGNYHAMLVFGATP